MRCSDGCEVILSEDLLLFLVGKRELGRYNVEQ
jgi:hypothetical protein